GQLLQALQWFGQNAAPAAAGVSNGPPARAAAYSASTAATQIAALNRVGLPAAYRDGENIKLNIRLALPYAQIADAGLLERATTRVRDTLRAAGLQATSVAGSPNLEALVPLARLEWVAALDSVGQIGLMALPDLDVTSDGLAASGVDTLRGLGNYAGLAADLRRELRGDGMTVAIIDQFGSNAIAGLQAADEWPRNTAQNPNKLVQTASGDGNAFGAGQGSHGNAVTEIVYDIAPNANFRLYDMRRTSDWVSAIQNAANLNSRNEVQGEPRAQVISFSLGLGGQSSGDGSGTGSDIKGLYDAISAAKANGVLLIKSAGNEAQSYWDADSTAGAGNAVAQDFVAGNVNANGAAILDDVNILRYGSNWGDCVPVGVADADIADQLAFNVRTTWNDWTTAQRNTATDYRLELVRWADQSVKRVRDPITGRLRNEVVPAGWVVAQQSDNAQNGGNGQKPYESIAYAPPAATKTTRCDNVLSGAGTIGGSRYTGGGIFGVRIVRKTANAANFLRLFARPHRPQYSVPDRSLSSPADSASVITVAALDAATSNLEAYSSRGPVLAAGGARPAGQAAGNAKPDVANFANVDTVSYGDNEFNGTSSATPHVGALALLGLQHQRQLTNATVPAALPANATQAQKDARTALLKQRRIDLAEATYDTVVKVAGTGGNDLGAAGFDASYGNGRLKFHAASQACFLSALYDASYRALLPAQAKPLPQGVKSYDQLLAENSAACSAP
ncbi:S8 family serine peptidase, partial [Pseudomonas sp. CGJS7]|uniref:S8 family serine peptidase n=1 Tax=Pseudomonas sp. CGJS7 TaxID=3109348 RepID=UPI00300AF7F0